MTCDKVRGKMTLKFENRKDGSKALVDIELDEIAMIEITNFIEGFYAGTKIVNNGDIYGSVQISVTEKIVDRYINLDTTISRKEIYKLLHKKLEAFNGI